YIAYTSDIAESFRPVAAPRLVSAGYAVSWTYVVGDVAHEGYRAFVSAREKGGDVPLAEDYRTVVVRRGLFQSLASLALPAATVHGVVRGGAWAVRGAGKGALRAYGPVGLGLATVPFLPYIFDKPVEEAVDWSVDRVVRAIERRRGGKEKEL
ncbi:hypothetical protein FGG08_007563, partial [Glutinoglossum americanum]